MSNETKTDPLNDWFRKIGTSLSDEDYEAGIRAITAHDAEQQRIGAEAALAYVKAQALGPRQAATEGPLVGRILVSHWCDKAASAGAGGLEREGGSDV